MIDFLIIRVFKIQIWFGNAIFYAFKKIFLTFVKYISPTPLFLIPWTDYGGVLLTN